MPILYFELNQPFQILHSVFYFCASATSVADPSTIVYDVEANRLDPSWPPSFLAGQLSDHVGDGGRGSRVGWFDLLLFYWSVGHFFIQFYLIVTWRCESSPNTGWTYNHWRRQTISSTALIEQSDFRNIWERYLSVEISCPKIKKFWIWPDRVWIHSTVAKQCLGSGSACFWVSRIRIH